MPADLQSLVPGLKARVMDESVDTEVAIIGFPVTSSNAKFSTSLVKDRNHMAGSSIGTSGSPLLVQGRVAVGVHEGSTSGEQLKRFHPFTLKDVEAIRRQHHAPLTPPPSPDRSLKKEAYPVKKREHRADRIAVKSDDWADTEADERWEHDQMLISMFQESQKKFNDELRNKVAQVEVLLKKDKAPKKKVSGKKKSPVKPEAKGYESDSSSGSTRRARARPKGPKPPCPNTLKYGGCCIEGCAFDHKLKSYTDFPKAPPKGPNGQSNSKRSLA
jgi:hypothetical protein